MKMIRTFILLFFLSVSAGMLKAQTLFDPADTYVVIAGVLKWEDSLIHPFSDVNRKDKELYETLKQSGVPEANMKLLLDEKATRSNILSAIDEVTGNSGEKSTFIFYYAGHGVKEGNNYFFCNYDFGKKSKSRLNVNSINKNLSKKFKGKRIILMADCCYSGALIEQGKILSSNDREVVVMTSATASNVSTGNWTFTQTIIDNFKGMPEGDADGNNEISLGELKNELYMAMRYRERQLAGFYIGSEVDTKKVSVSKVKEEKKKTVTEEGLTTNQYVYALTKGNWQAGRVKGMHVSDINIEFYEYSDKREEIIHRKNVKPIQTPDYSKYSSVKIEWNKKYYPAEILKKEGDFYYIHYNGYDDSWNEWVMYDRIKTGDEKKAKGKWNLGWYDVNILQEKDGKYFITYIGYDPTWDEWVTKDRIK